MPSLQNFHFGLSLSLKVGLLCILAAVSVHANSWPQWRGADASGHFEGEGFPTQWDSSKNIIWKAEIPGKGHSSPVLEGDLVWITTAYETPADPKDAKERLKSNTGGQPLTLLESVSLRAVRIDPKSGKVLKNIEVLKKKKPQWVHKLNSYASTTPCLEDGKLYCHFGAFGNVCLDAETGEILWKNDDERLWVMHENGPGSSPVLWGDFMILHLDGSDKQSIVALHKKNGKITWQSKRSGKMHQSLFRTRERTCSSRLPPIGFTATIPQLEKKTGSCPMGCSVFPMCLVQYTGTECCSFPPAS